MPIAAINGTEIYFERYGEGPPIILAHGGGSNHLTFWPQVWDLKSDYTVVTFDHRGFGLSAPGPASAFVDDFAALVDHLGFKRVAVLGQSMGGYTVAGFAARHPSRVSALILCSGGAGLMPLPPGGHSARAANQAVQAASNDEFIDRARQNDAFHKRNPRDNFLFESIGRLNCRLDPRQLGEVAKFRFDVAPIADAGIPTLLVAGEEDSSNVEVMKKLAEQIPGARFEAIAGTAHHLTFEKPDEFNQLLRRFLQEQSARLRV